MFQNCKTVCFSFNKTGPDWALHLHAYFPDWSWRWNTPDDWFEEDQQRLDEHGGMDDIQSLYILLISKIIRRSDSSVKISRLQLSILNTAENAL